jgi:hypothetical protein
LIKRHSLQQLTKLDSNLQVCQCSPSSLKKRINFPDEAANVFTLDNTPPVLEFRGNLPDNVNSNTQTFSWTSSEYANFKCYIDSDSQPFSCGDKGSWTLSELIDGQHTFRVFGTDRYGNQGPAIQHTWNIGTM